MRGATRADLLQVPASKAGGEEGKTSSKALFERYLAAMMESRLFVSAFAPLREMGEIAAKMGVSLYLVGGTALDLITLKPIRDLDFTFTGELSEFTRALEKARPGGERRSRPALQDPRPDFAGEPESYTLDFSSSRVERYERPGAGARRPSRDAARLLQPDIRGRDFTVNALAIGLNLAEFGKLLAYYGGCQDVRDGLIRTLQGLSFVEDPTRAPFWASALKTAWAFGAVA